MNWHDFFTYRDDGKLIWKVSRPGGKAKAGQVAGYSRADGYALLRLKGSPYLVHRVIYAMHHGHMPEVVDHIDGDPANNRIENLRAADMCKNQQNRRLCSRNRLGMKNVYYHKRDNLYGVRLVVDGKVTRLGFYKDLELAELVATMARDKYFGEFARHE